MEVLVNFSQSPAFSCSDATFLLHHLADYNGDLLPLTKLLLSVGNYYVNSQQRTESETNGRYAFNNYTPLLLKLYEQAREAKDEAIQNQCLDIWDAMFAQQVASVYDISNAIG